MICSMKTYLKLRGDDNAKTDIQNLEMFRSLHPMIRADFLQDWIAELTDEYNLSLDHLSQKWAKERGDEK